MEPDRACNANCAGRRRTVGSIFATGFWVTLALGSVPTLAAAAPIPKLAITVANRPDLRAALASLERCFSTGPASIVAPALDVRFGGASRPPVDLTDVSAVVGGVSAGRAVILHIRLDTGDSAGTDRPGESAIEQQVAEIVAALPVGSAAVKGAILEIGASSKDFTRLQFVLATLVLQLKAAKPVLQITVAFPPGLVLAEKDMARRVTAYADFVGLTYGNDWRREAEWVGSELRKPLALSIGAAAPDFDASPADALIRALIESSDADVDTLWTANASPEQAAALCRAHGVVSTDLRSSFSSAPLAKAPLTLTIDEGPLLAGVFIDSGSPDLAFLVRSTGTRERPRALTVSSGSDAAFTLTCRDALDGHRLAAAPAQAAGKTTTHSCSADGRFAVVSIQRGDANQRLYESVSVVGRGGMRVEEIIARWQQYRELQKRRLDNYSAECLLTLHFEATALGSGFDIALQLRLFADRAGQRDWVQEAMFVNGVKFKKGAAFPLPQLEPEKVVTQPLELKLDEKYRYSLLGTDTINGAVTYVVGIEPETPGAMLFSGKVWIDGLSFRQVRMQLQQKGGRSNVQSSIETQDYALVTAGDGESYNLLASTYVQQITNAAGRSFLIEKTYKFSNHQINNPAFERTLAEARASDMRMFRDTSEGLRVLRNDKGTRVVEPQSTRVKAVVLGTLFEGSYSFPIPLAGLSLVDFDFRKTGSQLSVFFAGPVLATNLSKQLGQKFRIGADLGLSAIPTNNRAFVGATESVAQGFRDFQESLGILGSWQAAPSLSASVSSYLTADFFGRTKDTAQSFQASGHGFTVLTSGELKFVSHGFTITGNATQGSRFGWSDLGVAGGTPVVAGQQFVKYSGEFAKQFYVGQFSKIAFSAAYYGGDRLDRLSRYQPSFLAKPRIRGVPNGTDSFDQIGVAGLSYSFNVLDVVKVEGMYNRAWGQNKTESRAFKTFEGLELGLGTIGPWSTFVQASVTYALQGNLDRYRSRWGAYVLIFKPLGK